MGRGRQKAKATRVARDLKYSNTEMDLERLSKELHGEVSQEQSENDEDPFAEGNYIARA
ncbi:MAG: DUF3073 domain-containing protein [SAR202 cluster bacterium]|jgi:hypothetical protein|nr:DUF3073 domain-containing protein [SAR202 cluster bacterium]